MPHSSLIKLLSTVISKYESLAIWIQNHSLKCNSRKFNLAWFAFAFKLSCLVGCLIIRIRKLYIEIWIWKHSVLQATSILKYRSTLLISGKQFVKRQSLKRLQLKILYWVKFFNVWTSTLYPSFRLVYLEISTIRPKPLYLQSHTSGWNYS